MTKSKLSQGELVQNCLVKSPVPLIDVGVNLVDHSFDKASRSNSQILTLQQDCETNSFPMCSSTKEEHLTLLQEGLVCVVVGGGGCSSSLAAG